METLKQTYMCQSPPRNLHFAPVRISVVSITWLLLWSSNRNLPALRLHSDEVNDRIFLPSIAIASQASPWCFVFTTWSLRSKSWRLMFSQLPRSEYFVLDVWYTAFAMLWLCIDWCCGVVAFSWNRSTLKLVLAWLSGLSGFLPTPWRRASPV